MRLLVTGGAGFIGANFVHQTVGEHPAHEVTVLDALTYAGSEASLAGVREAITFVHGSITDAAGRQAWPPRRRAAPTRLVSRRSSGPP